jgi:hypothetical protein
MQALIARPQKGEKIVEKDKIDVLVIGTEPPCPRCDLLGLIVEEMAHEQSVEVNLRHCAFDAADAIAVGQRLARKVGTAKEVAEAAKIQMDWEAVYGLIQSKRDAIGPHSRAADTWTSELDEMLRPCQHAADSVGYFMTPVLVVNGTVKHHGSVPSRDEVRALVLGEQESS